MPKTTKKLRPVAPRPDARRARRPGGARCTYTDQRSRRLAELPLPHVDAVHADGTAVVASGDEILLGGPGGGPRHRTYMICANATTPREAYNYTDDKRPTSKSNELSADEVPDRREPWRKATATEGPGEGKGAPSRHVSATMGGILSGTRVCSARLRFHRKREIKAHFLCLTGGQIKRSATEAQRRGW